MATTTLTVADTQNAVPLHALDTSRGSSISQTPFSQDPQRHETPFDHTDRKTAIRLMSAGFAFFTAGANDGSLGPLIPYILRDYNVSTGIVSSVYGASFAGWLFAAITNTHLSQRLDRGIMLALGALFQILSQVFRVWRPPFGLFVVTFFLTTIGQGFQDTHANNFVADAKAAHRWLGFIHAMWMLGSLVGPFVSTAVAAAGDGTTWQYFYAFPLGLGVINLAFTTVAFWDEMRLHRARDSSPEASEGSVSSQDSPSGLIKATFTTASFWLLSLFYFFYLGAALTASGWVVEYLVTVRGGDVAQVGFVAAGFSGGGFLGRLFLTELIHRWGVKKMVALCCIAAIGFQLVFWLVPNIIAASIAVSLLGFFTSPFFPVGVSVGSKLFPAEIRPTALAFLFVIAQIGGSLFPVITGVLASNLGVGVLQPMLVGILAATLMSWLIVPKPKVSGNTELHQE